VGGNTILVGDFNLLGVEWEVNRTNNVKGREILDVVMEEGLVQLVNFPTHTKGNVLDLVLTNCSDRILEVSDVGRLGKSDFCSSSQVKNSSRYNWHKANIDQINSDLLIENWTATLAGKTVEDAWNSFKDSLLESVERNVPKCGTGMKLKNPWMTREILRLVRKKWRKWQAVKSSRTPEELKEYQELEQERAKRIQNMKTKLEKDLAAGDGYIQRLL
jgi:hypothetical protein